MLRFSVCRFLARVSAWSSALIAVFTALLSICGSTAMAQTSNLEVGTVLAAGKVIWVRATTSGAVELFMSQGYRDALARPSLVDANRLAHWTDSAKALTAPSAGVVEARSAADTGLAFDRWVGADSSGLEIKQDGSTVLRVSNTPARELVDLLARGAQLSQRLSAPPPRQVVVNTDTTVPAVVTQTLSAAAAPEATPPAAPIVDSIPNAPLVDSAPPAPMREPTLSPSLDANLRRDAAPIAPSIDTRRSSVAITEVKAPALPPTTLLDKHIETPLGPFVVPAAKLTDHDTQIKYCYTELGLRYDRHLTGEVTVRVNVNDAGIADTVEVTKRTWDGVPAAEVESCMRALIEDWSFDDRQPADSKTIELHFTLSPAMRTAAADATAAQHSSEPR